ncbi:hypothetical protein [Thermoanaerobacter siderophilus]|uniref:hypothetical protein n=1 Tax=Thermoanaerobacter siderophilus TaxID=106578 RepID=UPI0005874826
MKKNRGSKIITGGELHLIKTGEKVPIRRKEVLEMLEAPRIGKDKIIWGDNLKGQKLCQILSAFMTIKSSKKCMMRVTLTPRTRGREFRVLKTGQDFQT